MNFCLYRPIQEENIFIRKRTQTWQRSGLLTKKQLQIIQEQTEPHLTETSLFFRLLFIFFTWVCILATIGVLLLPTLSTDEIRIGYIFLFFSIPTYGLAEYVIQTYHFYRHGIEEAAALAALFLFTGGITIFFTSLPGQLNGYHHVVIIFAFLTCFLAYWLYLRFGFLYAALISMVALCVIPFHFSLPPLWERILLFLLLGLLLLISLQTESDAMEDFRKKRKELIQTCLFAGIYLSVNVRIFEVAESWFDQIPPRLTPWAGLPPEAYWVSYGLTFLVPAVGLYLGIKARKRTLINVAAIALALGLATNKDYLGLKHYPWDPMVFGLTLILGVVLIIRWLAKGQNKERYGFTEESILKPEQYGLSLPEIGAAALPGIASAPGETAPPTPSPFEDGQSGGGGASRSF